jgi:hypothetical protein
LVSCVGAKILALTELPLSICDGKNMITKNTKGKLFALMLSTIMLEPVLPIPESKRLTIGQSIN